MDKRISLECRGKPPSEIKKLDLDNCRTTGEFEGLTDDFTSLETLSVVQAGLTTLKGFPTLDSLRTIDLSENRISGGLQYMNQCKKLRSINLSNNKIKDLEAFEPLKSLESLRSLEIAHNDISWPPTGSNTDEEQRKLVFDLLPNLTSVDGYDREGNEYSDEEENVPNGTTNRLADDGDDDEDGDDEDGLEEEEVEEEEDEDDVAEGPGLAALYDDVSALNDDEDGDYDEEAEIDEDVEEEEDEEDDDAEPESTRGKKRKHEEEGGDV